MCILVHSVAWCPDGMPLAAAAYEDGDVPKNWAEAVGATGASVATGGARKTKGKKRSGERSTASKCRKRRVTELLEEVEVMSQEDSRVCSPAGSHADESSGPSPLLPPVSAKNEAEGMVLDAFSEHAQEERLPVGCFTDTESEQVGLRRIMNSAMDRYLHVAAKDASLQQADEQVYYPEKRDYEEGFLHTVGKNASDRPCRNATSTSEKCVASALWREELQDSPMVEFIPSRLRGKVSSETPSRVCLLCLRFEIQCASYGCIQDGVAKSKACAIAAHYNIVNQPREYLADDCIFPQSANTGIVGPCAKCSKHKMQLCRVATSSASSSGYWQLRQLFGTMPDPEAGVMPDF